MSSNDKRDLTTKGTTSKPVGAENTVTGDIVTLPPDADDVIFSTICDSSVTGTVDAELEMSYDKENWCPAVTEEYTEGESVEGWGNERYVLTKVTDQDKNKHGRGVLNFDTNGTEVSSGGTRDVLFDFIQRDKPFNFSYWAKSEDQPSATVIHSFDNEKYFEKDGNEDDYIKVAGIGGSSGAVISSTEDWTVSFWIKSSDTSGHVFFTTGNQGGIQFFQSSGTTYAQVSTAGDWKDVEIGSGAWACDGNWNLVTITFKKVASSGDTWTFDPIHNGGSDGDSGMTFYLNGARVARTGGSVTANQDFNEAAYNFKWWKRPDYSGSAIDSVNGDYDQLAIFDEFKTATQVAAMYDSGKPVDVSTSGDWGSAAIHLLNADDMSTTGSALANSTTVTDSGTGSYVATNYTDGGTGVTVKDLGTDESIYIAPSIQSTTNNYNPIIFRHGNKDPFVNAKYLNCVPKTDASPTGEKKNKYLSAPANIGFTNTKVFNKVDDDDENVLSISKVWGGDSDRIIGTDKDWTIALWYKQGNQSYERGALWGFGELSSNTTDGSSICLACSTHGNFGIEVRDAGTWYGMYAGTASGVVNDGDWHHIVLTFKSPGSSGTWYNDPIAQGQAATDPGITLYVDGTRQVYVTNVYSNYSVASNTVVMDDTSGSINDPLHIGRLADYTSYNGAMGDYNNIAIFSETKTATQVNDLYASGAGTDLSSDSSLKYLAEFEKNTSGTALSTGALSNGDTTSISNSASTGSTYVTTVVSPSAGDLTIANLPSSDPTYNIETDIFHSKMGQDKEFTLNTWFKSSTAPNSTDYLPVLFNNGAKAPATQIYGNEKCLTWDGTFGLDQEHIKVDKISDTSDSDCLITTDKDWTVSFWMKKGSSNPANQVPFFSTGWSTTVGGLMLYTSGSSLTLDIYANTTGSSSYSYITWLAGYTNDVYYDGDWHHVMLTWKGVDSEGDAWSGKQADPDGSWRGPRLYIDGIYRQSYGLGGFSGSPSYESTSIINSSTATDDFTIGGLPNYSGGGWGSDANGMQMMDFSVHNEYKNSTAARALYNRGLPLDLKTNDSSTKFWLNFEGSGDIEDGDDIPNVMGTYTATAGVNGAGGLNYDALPVISSEYRKSVAADDTFANGLTASFTKKIVTSDTQGNTGYLRLPLAEKDTNSTFKMGASSTWNNDGDNFFFRRETDSYTISWWMRTDYLQSVDSYYYDNHIFSNGSTTVWEGLSISVRGTKLRLGLQGTGSVYAWNSFEASGWDDGDWHHYAVTWNPTGMTDDAASPDFSNLKLYRNGSAVSVDSTVSSGAFLNDDYDTNSTGEVRFGAHANPYSQNGVIEMDLNDIAIWKTDLSATQINTIYNSGQPNDISSIESSSLKRYYKFDRRDGTDEAGNHTGTLGSLASFRLFETGDDTYAAASFADTFDETAGQATSLLLSLDGFEDAADTWVSYPATSLLDGNWHNLQITWDGSGDGSASKTYGDSTEINNNLKVYVDGEWLASNASKGGTSTFTAADKHFKHTEGTFIPGTFGASGFAETGGADSKYAFQGALDNVSLHSEDINLTVAKEFYGKGGNYEGKPHNYQMSSSLTYAKVEGWWTFEEAGDAGQLSVVNDKTSNNIDLNMNNFLAGGHNFTDTLGESIEITSRVKGEGFTVSMTKNLKDDGTWVTTQDQTTRLVLSFNGFEADAEHFVGYNVNQGSPINVNLLDGLWHNVTISYQGTTNNDGTIYLDDNEIRFGPVSQGSTDQAYHIAVSFDGQKLTGISPEGAVDDGSGGTLSGITGWNVSKKLASGKMEAGFVIENKHLRHVSTVAEYTPTAYLASGIVEANGADSIYAFQGGFDESSFHSDTWWINEAGDTATPTAYNGEKAKTIYGNTGGLAPAQLTRRSPYDLLDPSSIGATSGSNQYVNPNPYDASSNPNGGIEVYYRWGDITGDCSSSVNDVRSAAADSDARDISVSLGSMSHSTALTTNALGSTDFEKDLTYDNSGTYKMYVQKSSSSSEGGLNTKNVKISGCTASKCQQQGVLAPKLPHMRVKWTGSGSCDLGEDKCRAQLWFRRRKK